MRSPKTASAPLRLPVAAAFVAIAAAVLAPPPDLVPSARAAEEQPHPSDVYLQAYLFMQEAERLERQREPNAAFFKYRDASDLFDSVSRTFPTWNPQMVDYRRRKIREKISELRREHSISADPDAGSPLGTAPGTPGGNAASPSAVIRPEPPASSTPSVVPPGTSGMSALSEIQQRFDQYESRIRRLEADRAQMLSELEAKEALLRDTRKQFLESRRLQEDFRQKLIASEEALGQAGDEQSEEVKTLRAQVADLKSELARAVQTIGEANDKTEVLLKELEDANATIKGLRANQKQLEAERDQLAAIVKGEAESPDSPKTLLVENLRLKRELDEANQTITRLTSTNEKSAEEIASLRTQLAEVRDELARIQQENADYQGEIAALTDKLRLAEGRLAGAPEASIPEAVEENRVLREIVKRQLKAQRYREQAKRAVLGELTKLEVNAASLLALVDEVAGPPVILTEQEESLFKDPQFDDFLDDSNMSATLIARGTPGPDGNPLAPSISGFPGTQGTPAVTGPLMGLASTAASEFERGNFEASARSYEQILEAEPQNVFAMEQLSIVRLRQRKLSDAETLLQKALAYNFENPVSHFLLGVTHFRQGKLKTAGESFIQGLQINPQNARAHLYLGMIALRNGRTREAELEFKESLAIDPSLADAHFNLAVLYATADEPSLELARQHYVEAINHGAQPDSAMERFLGS